MHNFLVRIISNFIIGKDKRRAFRRRHHKETKLEILEGKLKHHINVTFNRYFNSFYDINDLKIKPSNRIKAIQNKSNDLLIELVKICNKHKIPYWLDYGTLLGAYRHDGFIPWDDDIDIGMMRDDTIKLSKIMSKYPKFKFTEWMHLKTDKNSIRCKVAKFKHNSDDRSFVDIFTYDFVSPTIPNEFYDSYCVMKTNMQADLAKLKMDKYSFIECENEKDRDTIYKVFNKYINKYAGMKSGKMILYGIENPYNKARRIFDKNTIFPLSKITFNGKEYSAPNDIDTYLTVNFGDYMRIPLDIGIAKHIFCL